MAKSYAGAMFQRLIHIDKTQWIIHAEILEIVRIQLVGTGFELFNLSEKVG